MSRATAPAGMTIGRLAVRWQVAAELPEAGRGRLDTLVRELCDGPLEDALAAAAGRQPAEVCIRRVAVPAHRMHWDGADAELVSGWARAIGHAVRGTMVPGRDLVRYPSRSHARADLLVSVLAGDRERLWAWQLLGVWPAGTRTDAEAVSAAATAAAGEQPGALVALVVTAARAGQLGRFVEYVGPAALAALTHRAWLAAGGVRAPVLQAAAQGDAATGDATGAGRLAVLLRRRSEIIASALLLPAAGLAGPVRPAASPPPAGRGPGTGSPPPAGSGPQVGPPAWSAAESLALLAVLEAEPALAASPAAAAAAGTTAHVLLAAARAPRPGSAGPGSGPPPGRPDGAVPAGVTAPAGEPQPAIGQAGPAPPPAPPGAGPGNTRPGARPAAGGAGPARPGPGGATTWGGLLFLLPVVADAGIPASVTAGPAGYGTGLRPVLHELGRQLLLRAAPGAGPAAPDDPALLAFCGLSPRSGIPQPPPPAGARIGLDAGAVVTALRDRLPGLAADRGDAALLRSVCRRRAVIHADPGWIDVDLDLDEVDVDVRRAGLDLDPGYLAWLGCVVRFRYG